MAEQILILDFGSQYTQLIARRVRELNVYCEIHPFNKVPAIDSSIKGIILSGSPCSVRDAGSPDVDLTKFGNTPVLGICYGAQLIAHKTGGSVLPSHAREYGRARLNSVDHHNPLLKGMSLDTQVWMSHADTIASISNDFEIIATTSSVKVAAFHRKGKPLYGIQFHPEVTHTVEGKNLLKNFVAHICQCAQDWTPDLFVETTVNSLKAKLGDDKVVMALSGGVDSTVAASWCTVPSARISIAFLLTMGCSEKMNLIRSSTPTRGWDSISKVLTPSRNSILRYQVYLNLKRNEKQSAALLSKCLMKSHTESPT
jgi:GMP synthase (glutamine-hydrolysing)